MIRLVIATTNAGKLREFAALLPADFSPVSLFELGLAGVPENGTTLEENAVLKARAAGLATGLPALGDDSGLEVDALDGSPGLHSARFAGEPPDDEKNIARLLACLSDVAPEQRGAQFRCAVALVRGPSLIARGEGILRGRIVSSSRGDAGFGYDPIFELQDGRTLAELSSDEKNAISHRSRAVQSMKRAIEALRDRMLSEG